jgi:pimeloyl-ACP methyl ester carboxylesterase
VTDGGPRALDDPIIVRSADGTGIATFVTGAGSPLVLVHGTTADHTTWRAVGPLLRRSFTIVVMDRRGRGASGDGQPYAIAREEEDVAAVVRWTGANLDGPVSVVGHSYGGRCALGAAVIGAPIDRLVIYEGPVSRASFGETSAIADELDGLLAAGQPVVLLETFMRRVVGLGDEEWAAFAASETFPLRVAAAHTVPRELRAGVGDASEIDRFATVRQPVLQVMGGASDRRFGAAAAALAAVLADARTVVIPGAKHAAHHTHPQEFVAAVEAFASH